MAACLYGNACFLYISQSLHINLGGGEQCLAQSGPQLIIICVQAFLCQLLLKYLAHQRKAIAVYTGRSHSNQDIPRTQVLTCNQVLLIYNTHRESCQVVLILRIKARHLCCLSANQGRTGLPASLSHTLYNRGNFLRNILAAGNIIQEEQRLTTSAGHVVDTHSHTVDSHCVMLIHQKCQFQLGSHAVSTGQQSRLLHPLERGHGKCS